MKGFSTKNENLKKTDKMAYLKDWRLNGQATRRIYVDNCGLEYVIINGSKTLLEWCRQHFESVEVFF